MTEDKDSISIKVCTLCPRNCGADRTVAQGRCGGGGSARIARAALHQWEEPCISGTRGSGTVFFSGCPLGCCFCQNSTISARNDGKDISIQRLADIFLELQEAGAHNINLVSPTQYVPWIVNALTSVKAQLTIPVVYNTGGYERVVTLRQLEGLVDIYLPDLKFKSVELATKYCNAPDYFETATAAILEMFRQVGPLQYDDTGLLRRGLLIRHLVLPAGRRDSAAVLEWIGEHLPPSEILISLMSQYTPYETLPYKELNRRISTYEYQSVVDKALELGLDGFMQERSSAKEEYTPPFDCTGV
ncbi:MAG: radical SAM protein [Angelakisella sp.]|nr:radical SAM protein [Angelakisella sp.]